MQIITNKKSYSLPIWFLLCVLVIICLLAVYFLSGIVKWVILFLITIAYAGLGVKEGIKGILWLFFISIIAFIILWMMESPEYRSGMRAFENGDYSTAIEKLNQELKKNPDHPKAYLARCLATSKSGRPEQALSDCNKAITLGHDRKDESYAARSRVYSDLGMLKNAIDDFTVALKYTEWDSISSKWYILYERGIVNEKFGRHDGAIRDFRAVFALNEDWYHAWLPLGNAYYSKGDEQKALQAYKKYLKSYDPKVDSFPEALKRRMLYLRNSHPK